MGELLVVASVVVVGFVLLSLVSTARLGSRRVTALAGLAGVALVAACGGTGPGTGPGTDPTPSATEPAPSPTVEPSETPESSEIPVYFLIDTRAGLRLARELREVTGDPVAGAVGTMIAGPLDPDYSTTWNPATTVLGVERDGATVVVDLSGDALTANVGSEAAALMVQQLVYTVVGAVGEDVRVLLHIDGEPAGDLWGATTWPDPVAPVDPLNVRLLVQIDQPAEGAETTSPVTVSGDAAVFEANLLWHVLDAAGAEVASGFTMTTEGQTFAPYSFTVDLEPGEYTVVIVEDDPSGGEGGTPMSDTATVTVS